MKNIRYIAWGLIVILLGAVGYVTLNPARETGTNSFVGAADIGGPFTLVDHNGKTVDQTVFDAKPYAIFFGFTHCPEICPTSLYEMAGWIEKLGPEANDLGYAFVSVDPTRDTPDVIKDYVEAFSDKITGLTGSEEQVADIVQSYRVYARKVPLEDDDYTMDHTASVFLMKSDGTFHGTIAYGEDPDVALKKLQNLAETAS
ncbi:MAG: SCO family protein [Hyphomicrobiales bacterium]